MARFSALYDACVIYSAPVRDLLIRLALLDLFQAKWSEDIHREWTTRLLENRPDLTPEQLERVKTLMDKHVQSSLVTGYADLVPALRLPDPNDRHVLAAAIAGHCDVIVTYDTKDFPKEALKPYGIDVQHPDEFITHLIDLSPHSVLGVVRKQQQTLKNPPVSMETLLQTFEEKACLPMTVQYLRNYL